MKRRELLRHLAEHGCSLLREGANHSVFLNSVGNRLSTVPCDRADGADVKIGEG